MSALLTLREVSLTLGERTVLDRVSLQLRRGQILTVIGPNGAGKSSLLKVALGLAAPSSGSVQRAEGCRIGYMPQRLQLDPTLPISVGRFLALGGNDNRRIEAALGETGVTHLRGSPLQAISGGELQRVLLARALLREPDLLVLDEPAQGVDLTGQTALYELIASLSRRLDCGVLMVSHDLHWVMAQTDEVICLNQHICCRGHPEQVGSDPAYRALFGAIPGIAPVAPALAPYLHHHNHAHDLHGDVVATGSGGDECCGHHHG
jgi:zinc transport system ATP-binding protein